MELMSLIYRHDTQESKKRIPGNQGEAQMAITPSLEKTYYYFFISYIKEKLGLQASGIWSIGQFML